MLNQHPEHRFLATKSMGKILTQWWTAPRLILPQFYHEISISTSVHHQPPNLASQLAHHRQAPSFTTEGIYTSVASNNRATWGCFLWTAAITTNQVIDSSSNSSDPITSADSLNSFLRLFQTPRCHLTSLLPIHQPLVASEGWWPLARKPQEIFCSYPSLDRLASQERYRVVPWRKSRIGNTMHDLWLGVGIILGVTAGIFVLLWVFTSRCLCDVRYRRGDLKGALDACRLRKRRLGVL